MLSLLSWDEFRGLALYRQFIVGTMVLYALAMAALTAVFAVNGNVASVLTLVVAVVVLVVALTVVPARLGAAGTRE